MPSFADGCDRTPNLLVPQVSSPSHIWSICAHFPARTQKSLQDFAVSGACFGWPLHVYTSAPSNHLRQVLSTLSLSQMTTCGSGR